MRFFDDLVLVIQDVLRIVDFDGEGVAEVVEKREEFITRHHTVSRHRHAIRLLDSLLKFIEILKNTIHAHQATPEKALNCGRHPGRRFARTRTCKVC